MKAGDKVKSVYSGVVGIVKSLKGNSLNSNSNLIVVELGGNFLHAFKDDWQVVDEKPTRHSLSWHKALEDALRQGCSSIETPFDPIHPSWLPIDSERYLASIGRLPVLEGPCKDLWEMPMYDYAAFMARRIPIPIPYAAKTRITCECGSESIGSQAHSSWCPKVSV